jgi:hypothetical protein
MTTRLSAITFTSDIARLTENFTGRQWVFDDLDRWLNESEERFFILTGEPGVGKSAIAARLTQIREDVAAYHFCRVGDVETVRPGRILRSLAAQLGEHLPDYGQALANTIKPLHLRIEVNINIGSMAGSDVTGVYIENLKESDPMTELDILIRAPLEELQKMYAGRQQTQTKLAIILIDSLDEAVTTTGTNLVRLLTQLSQSTSLPSWVRFILTSRPERRVLRGFEPSKPYDLQETLNESLCDIRRYVENRFNQPTLLELLNIHKVPPQTFINEITKLSKGNFLYTKLLLNDVEAGQQNLNNLSALPKSIAEIYHGFLCRFSEVDWSEKYKPIFGVLTVAQEPISEDQISNFTKIDSEDVRDRIRVIRQFFDIEINKKNQEIYSIFHQSFREYLLDKDQNPDFWCNAIKQNQRITTYYWRYCEDWIKCDNYGLAHLAGHLYHGKQFDSLAALIAPEWMLARVDSDGYRYNGFIADLALASQVACDEASRQIEADDKEFSAFATCFRYALIRTSINSLMSNCLSALVQRALETGLWRAERALDVAAHNPDAEDRVSMYAAVLKIGSATLTDAQLNEVLRAGLATAHAIRYEGYRAQALATLATQLCGELQADVLGEALSAARVIVNEWGRADAMVALAPQLRSDQLSKALSEAHAMWSEEGRARLLTGLAPHLRDEQMEEALALAQGISREPYRAKALAVLSARLDGERRTDVLSEALSGARESASEYERTEALAALAPQLCGPHLDEALATTRAIVDEMYRVQALAALVPRLSEYRQADVLGEALFAARAIMHEWFRSQALASLAPLLCGELQAVVLGEALAATRSVANEAVVAKVLSALAPQLRDKQLHVALTMALAIGNENCRADAMMALAPQLTGEYLDEALAAVQAIGDEGSRANVLTALAPQLHGDQLNKALTMSLAIRYKEARAQALTALAPQLRGAQLEKALEVRVRKFEDDSERAQALTALAPRLRGKMQRDVLDEALCAARATQFETTRADLLTALARQLCGELQRDVLDEALAAAQAIGDERHRASALTDLVPQLRGKLQRDVFREALAVARGIEKELYREPRLTALAALAPQIWEIGNSAECLNRPLAVPLETDPKIRAEIRRSLVDRLAALVAQGKRAPLFYEIANTNVVCEPIMGAETIAALARHIIEINRQWRWV